MFFGDFFGLFRENSVCFGCFYTDPKHGNKPKQTENNVFLFRKTNRKTTETDQVSVCFGWNRKKNLIVSRTPYPLQIDWRWSVAVQNLLCWLACSVHNGPPPLKYKFFSGFPLGLYSLWSGHSTVASPATALSPSPFEEGWDVGPHTTALWNETLYRTELGTDLRLARLWLVGFLWKKFIQKLL
jgi:hypothetical protein